MSYVINTRAKSNASMTYTGTLKKPGTGLIVSMHEVSGHTAQIILRTRHPTIVAPLIPLREVTDQVPSEMTDHLRKAINRSHIEWNRRWTVTVNSKVVLKFRTTVSTDA